MFCILPTQENTQTATTELAKYQARCLLPENLGTFPINPKLKDKANDQEQQEGEGEGKWDPNAINLKLPELVRLFHGNFESKVKLIEDFAEAHPECSRNSIEKKVKELFVKDKRDNDPKQRYYVLETAFESGPLAELFPGGLSNSELVELARSRAQPLLDEIAAIEREQEEKRKAEAAMREAEKTERELMRQEEVALREMQRREERLAREKEREE